MLTKNNKALFKSGGGILSVSEVNVLTDSSTYTLPPADLIKLNEYIEIEIPDLYKAQTPVIQRQESDEIIYSGGTVTSYTFNSGVKEAIKLYSDGVDTWSF
jgi:hypothetical protein